MKYFTLNTVFVLYLVTFALVVGGLVPRAIILPVSVILIVWCVVAPLETATLFFIRSIPLFVAIPLTAAHDGFNMWRPLALALFVRMLLDKNNLAALRSHMRHPVFRLCVALLALAALSLIGAAHPIAGIVRIIYFVNLSLVPIIVFTLLRRGVLASNDAIRNIAVPVLVVVVVGFVQLASTYLMDVYQFMRLWGEGIQLRQFGSQWSHIAVWVGNTWLAYYGSQLSLRVFSLFPDSHSFPTFIVLGIPALFAIAIGPIIRLADRTRLATLIRAPVARSIVLVPIAYLAAIVSGTRGIWVSGFATIILAACLALVLRRRQIDVARRRVFAYMSCYMALFAALFLVAWPIFVSPQFLIGKTNLGLFGDRIKSVIDFGETSNSIRIMIWKASLVSIARHPFFGVGIGNFPVVIGQDIRLARAGSTAHNLYLHIAAEMGIPAALVAIALLAYSWHAALRWFIQARGMALSYSGAAMLSLFWVFAYVMTDPIIFDERVFLMFGATIALILANHD